MRPTGTFPGNEEAVAAAIAQATHVTRAKLNVTRVAPNPMEPRSCVVRYDRDTGQLMTGSFMDYCMPRAGLIPGIRMEDSPVPSASNVLGVKGVGESGCTASMPSLANAVMDALRPLGVQHLDMPMTPVKVWRAIQAAKARAR